MAVNIKRFTTIKINGNSVHLYLKKWEQDNRTIAPEQLRP